MCGFGGSTNDLDPSTLNEMGARLAHRGPDDAATWRDPKGGLGLAFRRLAIIDLSPGGRQPMVSRCGRYAIAYNGEIYNYRDLRTAMERVGETFDTASDTEVLLRQMMRRGVEGLHDLRGMFAFALWDRQRRELLLVRDRLGIKPLVYAPLGNGGLAFASEIHALGAIPGVDQTIDRRALAAYLACLYVPSPMTMLEGVRKLPPGHLLRWRDGITSVEPYWQPRMAGGRRASVDEAVEEILPVLRKAVTGRMIADVPVGCFLSGGIDSSVIAALMAEEAAAQGAQPIRTFTMTFEQPAYDERGPAATVARHVGARHTELPASPAVADLLDDALDSFGEPFGNPTALLVNDLSRMARRHVTVALAGDGGDEVFAGYPRYRGGLAAQSYRRLPGAARRAAAGLARAIPENARGHHGPRRAREFLAAGTLPPADMYASWVEYFDPAETRDLLDLGMAPPRPIAVRYGAAPSMHPLDAMQQTDLLSFLPGNVLAYGDAMSMRHGLELRLPLIDHRVVETVQTMAPEVRFRDGPKTLLKAVARRLLPASIVDRPKRGFNPPMGLWLKADLKGLVEERLTPAAMADAGVSWGPVARLLDEHRRGRRDVALKVWALIVLDAWRRRRVAA